MLRLLISSYVERRIHYKKHFQGFIEFIYRKIASKNAPKDEPLEIAIKTLNGDCRVEEKGNKKKSYHYAVLSNMLGSSTYGSYTTHKRAKRTETHP